jgi:hypothetical protein
MLPMIFALVFCQEETESKKLSTGLELAAPKKWKSVEPKSKMRLAQFAVPAKEGKSGDAELVIFHFGGKGAGTADANVDRWVGQFKGAKRDDAKIEKKKEPLEMVIVDLSGTYVDTAPGSDRKEQPDSRMLAAVVETPKGPHYVKLVGPAATVGAWEKEFRAFLESLKVADK